MTTVLLHEGSAAPKLEPPPRPQVRAVRGGNHGLNRVRHVMRTAVIVLILAVFGGLAISSLMSGATLMELNAQVDEVSVPQCHIIRRKSTDCDISIELHTIISVRGELFAIAAENRIFPIAREQEIRIALKKRRLRLLKHVFDCAELIQRSPLVRIQPKRLRLRVPVRRVFPESEQLPGIGHFFPFRLRRERRAQQQRGQRQAQQLVYLYFHRVLSSVLTLS